MDIQDKAALVTGAGSGLGAATAHKLASLGAKVAVVDLSEDAAQKVAGEIDGIGFGVDVADPAGIADVFAKARAQNGPVRILVNCAGIGPSDKIVSRGAPMAFEAFEQVVRVNLLGTFNALRLAAAEMAASDPVSNRRGDPERGVIVNTASIAAFEGQVGQAAYAASKGGVVALTLPAARELARHGIRVVTLAPGVFGTPMFLTVEEEWRAKIIDGIPFPKRAGDPEEFADAVRFICETPMLNGETIRLDASVRLA